MDPGKEEIEVAFAHHSNGEQPWMKVEMKGGDLARRKLKDYLHDLLTTPNLLVLAGSGTSLGKVKGPSMTDLWNKASAIAGFGDVLKIVSQPTNDTWIENLLSRCQSAKDFLPTAAVKQVADFIAACEKMILKECTDFVTGADLDSHKTFLRRMARRRSKAPRLRLYTTNYDRCFEEAASMLGMTMLDGFSFSSPRRYDARYFGYDIVRRARSVDDVSDFVAGVMQVFKLHGSVDWDRTAEGVIQRENPKTPCLIYPSTAKYEKSYTQPHLESMTQFQTALREPNTCLVVVGFGFNDNHLTAPILAALETNPSFRLLTVDRSAKSKSAVEGDGMHPRLLSWIKRNEADVAMMNASFEQFVDFIPQLKALSPAEQIERSIRSIAKGENERAS